MLVIDHLLAPPSGFAPPPSPPPFGLGAQALALPPIGSRFGRLGQTYVEISSKCGGPPVRVYDDGRIQVGEKVPKRNLPAAVNQWAPDIWAMSARYGIAPHLIAGVMAFESQGNKNASSGVAYGLMQLIPSTAAQMYNEMHGYGPGDPRRLTKASFSREVLTSDPQQNIELGVYYLKKLFDQYHGNIIHMAFAYNAGQVYCPAFGTTTTATTACGERGADGTCLRRCQNANQWGIVADCSPAKLGADGRAIISGGGLVCQDPCGTVDYANTVFSFANSALDGAFSLTAGPPAPPPAPPGTFPPSVAGSGGGGGAGAGLALVGFAVVAGLVVWALVGRSA